MATTFAETKDTPWELPVLAAELQRAEAQTGVDGTAKFMSFRQAQRRGTHGARRAEVETNRLSLEQTLAHVSVEAA